MALVLLPMSGNLFALNSKAHNASKSGKSSRGPKDNFHKSGITRSSSKGKMKQSRSGKSSSQSSRNGLSTDQKFSQFKHIYQSGKYSNEKLWSSLLDFESDKSKLSKKNLAILSQMQASMLLTDNMPVLASLYASDVLANAENPLKDEYRKSWYVLNKVSHRRSVQDIVEDLAGRLKLGAKVPPYFGTDWFYYEGNSEVSANRPQLALASFGRLQLNDRHFMSGKYQAALVQLEREDFSKAESSLKAMLNAANFTNAPIPVETKRELANFAKIGLARLFYQQQKFKDSIAFYRAVDRDSKHFYDSLFEQSWAFFMAGYPNHALGALHAVESPFYKDVFNPEASMLRSIIYYWMCRYDDSRVSLADFTERNSDDVEDLRAFLKRRHLANEDAYTLFENHISGVSAASLGLSKRILETAASEDAMLLLRDQLAYTVHEFERLQKFGIFKNKRNPYAANLLQKRIDGLKDKIGGQYLAELRSMEKDFDRLYEQAQFLYIELLMSEKEQLLGRELHASSKIDKVTRRKQIIGWANDGQSWSDSMKNEFWWDEVGFYIYDVKPLCKATH